MEKNRLKKIIRETLEEAIKPPIILYHATNSKFWLTGINKMKFPAHFFNNEIAPKEMGTKYIIKVKAKINKALRCYDENFKTWTLNSIRGTLTGGDGSRAIATEKEIQLFKEKYGAVNGLEPLLRKKGYDAIVYENDYEDQGEDSYILFNPNQIELLEILYYNNKNWTNHSL